MTTTATNSDGVLDVSEDDQDHYVQASYRDYLRTWVRLRRSLSTARGTGDIESEARFSRELRTLWPRPEVIARAAGLVDISD
jgi:hypothetical protein